MNGRVCLLAGLTVLAIIGLPVSSAPQGDDIQICLADTSEVLKGVKSISVLVDAIAKDAQEDGLNRGAIRTDVELRLRQSGIQVPTAAEELTNPSLPELYVNVHALKEKDKPIYIYNVLVEFKENACLERNRQM